MQIDRFFNRLKRIDQLIRLKATGNPKELADKLGISERMLYKYIEAMKNMEVPIAYSSTEKSYIYTRDGYIEIGFKEKKEKKIC